MSGCFVWRILLSTRAFFLVISAFILYVTVSAFMNNKNILPWGMFLCSKEHYIRQVAGQCIQKQIFAIRHLTGCVSCYIFKDIDCVSSQGVIPDLVVECCTLNDCYIRYSADDKLARPAPAEQYIISNGDGCQGTKTAFKAFATFYTVFSLFLPLFIVLYTLNCMCFEGLLKP